MRWRFAFLLLSVLSSETAAETVVIRSGDHAGFSRLVLQLESPAGWTMGRVGGGYEVRFDRGDLSFDTSRAFERIQRARIADVETSAARVGIRLADGCDCHADAFEFRPGMLVIDIKDGPPVGQTFETAFHADETRAEGPGSAESANGGSFASAVVLDPQTLPKGQNTDDRDSPDAHTDLGLVSPLPILMPREMRNPRIGSFSEPALDRTSVPQMLQPVPGDQVLAPLDGVQAMEDELLRQLSRAASQGLLEADVRLPNPGAVSEMPAADENTETEAADPPLALPHVRLHAETSIDRDLARDISVGTNAKPEEMCLPDLPFDITVWGYPEAPVRRISDLQTSVIGEFDTADPGAVANLARAYLYAGFGAEASAVLRAFDIRVEDAYVLRQMAEIVDDGSTSAESALESQLNCAGPGALWAALSMTKLPSGAQINKTAVLAAFSGLPLHLRRHLGPSLSQRFLDIGDDSTAHALHDAIARAHGDAGAELQILEARLQSDAGDRDGAVRTLTPVATDGGPHTAEAMIALLKVNSASGEPLDSALLTEAAALAFERRGTEAETELGRLLAISQAGSGKYMAAIETLRSLEVEEKVAGGEIDALWSEVLSIAARQAPDEAFLTLAFSLESEFETRDLLRKTRREVATRLGDFGLVDLSEAVLVAAGDPGVEDRLILARGAIASLQPAVALTELDGLSGEAAGRARARAYEMMRRYDLATAEYRKLSLVNEERHAAWRAGDWDTVEALGSAEERTAASLMRGGAAPDDLTEEDTPQAGQQVPEGVIARNRELLSRSSAARETLANLFEAFPPNSPDGS